MMNVLFKEFQGVAGAIPVIPKELEILGQHASKK